MWAELIGAGTTEHDVRLRIDEVRHLRRSATEVERQITSGDGQTARDVVPLVAPLDPAVHRVGTGLYARDPFAQDPLGVVAHGVGGGDDGAAAHLGDHVQ
jgi:hypothetical protein